MLIEIFADLICPWCLVGRTRLERALAEHGHPPSSIRWRPFLLNPLMPPAGMDRSLYLATRFGTAAQARRVDTAVQRAAAADGVGLAFDRIRTIPSSRDAHRLVAFAERHGAGDVAARAIMTAYLCDGRDIGDAGVLADIAQEIGLPRPGAVSWIDSDWGEQDIRSSIQLAGRLGIQAVPTFLFDRRWSLTGAQEAATFSPLLDLACVTAPAVMLTDAVGQASAA